MKDFSRASRQVIAECVGLRIRQTSRLLTRIYDEALRPLGIQESQFSILVAVAALGDDGATMGALASALVIDRTTLTRNVVPLEKLGHLRVARSAGDARVRVVHLGRSGERLIEAAYPLWQGAQAKIRRALGAARFDRLRTELSEVVACADELEIDVAAAE